MNVLFTMEIPTELKEKQKKQFPEIKNYYTSKIAQFPNLAEVDVIVTFGIDLTEKIIEQAKRLKWIMVFSAGVELLPTEKIKEKGITVTNARGIHAVPMAEFVFAYLLNEVKNLTQLKNKAEAREWADDVPIFELKGSKLFIAGTGAIGEKIAALGKAFEMKTIGFNTSGHEANNFDETYALKDVRKQVKQADFFVSILPNTTTTAYVYDKAFFQEMSQHAVFINIGRGKAVSLDVIKEAAVNQEIAHFYLDVLEKEPLPADEMLWNLNNVTITPHISAHSSQYLVRCFTIWFTNLNNQKEGKALLNSIDLNKGY
ncbi:NAD(P)-dependent oxidoreductase [Listeria sp. PSOL-1]|uniref:NAD(P)-dependent oxidoreductase n=1 Tax=Listeria sp. PSOL-1 TaxID=1844999 RepID=UPI0013CF90E9|nr:NAD(P)-dependent oxidoreductase [Listeria sp. PSOL-1]